MSFDRNGDLLNEPVPPPWEPRRVCTLCGRELTTVGIGSTTHERCPLHGSRGVAR